METSNVEMCMGASMQNIGSFRRRLSNRDRKTDSAERLQGTFQASPRCPAADGDQAIVSPPLTDKVWPVTKPAFSEVR